MAKNIKELEKKANAGDAEAQWDLFCHYKQSDESKAMLMLEKSAAQGFQQAVDRIVWEKCYELDEMLDNETDGLYTHFEEVEQSIKKFDNKFFCDCIKKVRSLFYPYHNAKVLPKCLVRNVVEHLIKIKNFPIWGNLEIDAARTIVGAVLFDLLTDHVAYDDEETKILITGWNVNYIYDINVGSLNLKDFIEWAKDDLGIEYTDTNKND